jgi:hypothetical protein
LKEEKKRAANNVKTFSLEEMKERDRGRGREGRR